MPIPNISEDEFNRRLGGRDNKNAPLDAEASMRIRVRAGDLRNLLSELDYAKEAIFPGTQTKIGVSGIRKVDADRPRIMKSEVSFRGKTNDQASVVLESILRRLLR